MVLTPEMGVQAVPSDFHGGPPEGTVGLLLGRSSTTLRGLVIHPGVIDPDFSGEVKILVSSPRGITIINPGDRIAQLLILPSHHDRYKSTGRLRDGGLGSTGNDLMCLTMDMSNRPMTVLKIRGKPFWGLLDTGADKSIINLADWPKQWPLVKANQTLRGLGIAHSPDVSAASLDWEDDEGHKGVFQPYVCSLPVTLWGRDVLEQMNIVLTTENHYSENARNMMKAMGYVPGRGLGPKGQGTPNPTPMGGQGFSQRPLRQ